MSDLLGLGSNGVLAYQRALVTISNNIANVATDGYSRQEVGMTSLMPRQVGNDYLGTGVATTAVRRQYDEFIESNLRSSVSNLTGQEPLVTYANRVIDLMAGEQTSLSPALTRFFEAARALSVSPGSMIARTSFLGDAGNLATAFRQLVEQVDAVDLESAEGIDTAVAKANTLAGQIALVNRQLQTKDLEAHQPPELLDQRDRLLRDLASVVQISTEIAPNGEVKVGFSTSFKDDVLVDRDNAVQLSAHRNAQDGRIDIQLGILQQRRTLAGVSGGTIGGLLAFREQVLGASRDRLDNIASTLVAAVNTVHRSGIDAMGLAGTDLFTFDAGVSPAAGIRVNLDDPRRVVAASPFRAVADALNLGTALASVTYAPTAFENPQDITTRFTSVGLPDAPQAFEVSLGLRALGSVPAGVADAVVLLDPVDGQWPQVITRDGRHLLGSALDATQQAAIMQSEGMMANATYSDAYLNPASTATAYLAADYFIGALAEPAVVPAYDPSTGDIAGQTVAAARLDATPMATSWSSGFAADAFVLNGVALPALATPSDAQDLADWINSVEASTGVHASATSVLRLPSDQVFSSNQVGRTVTLSASGMSTVSIVAPAGGFGSVGELAGAINAESASSGVFADVSPQGDLVLYAADAGHLTVGGDLLATSGTFGGSLTLTASNTTDDIRFGFGASGTPADLARLGLKTGVYWQGEAPEDLLVFVTGDGAAEVSASFRDDPVDVREAQRDAPFRITFTSTERYTITDVATGTVLADRPYDPTDPDAVIDYRGLQVSLNKTPVAGDRFVVDGNDNGIGDNTVMLSMIALEDSPLLAGGLTMQDGYLEQASRIGNVARQAGIARDALTVVHDQAVLARDEVAGVSLDQEAAELIRFQQAYQASAKVMQTATTLFDALLQVA